MGGEFDLTTPALREQVCSHHQHLHDSTFIVFLFSYEVHPNWWWVTPGRARLICDQSLFRRLYIQKWLQKTRFNESISYNVHIIRLSLSPDSFAATFRSFKATARLLGCSLGGIQEEVVSSMEDHVQVMAMNNCY